MSFTAPFKAGDWAGIELVVFDVDGTLYDQMRLRLRMLREIALDVLRRGSLEVPIVVGRYRRLREQIGDREISNIEAELVRRTGAMVGMSEAQVHAIVSEWIHVRPLPLLEAYRYDGVQQLFAGLRRRQKIVGVFSDYPAFDKLAAMGLAADIVVSGGDKDVGALKPNPLGLELLMSRANVAPAATVLVGDRVERDGVAAQRAGARSLIRSSRQQPGWTTFARFDDPIFGPMLAD